MIEVYDYNPDWQNRRIQFILNLYGPSFFKGKTVLELGAFNGYIGNYFSQLGSDVTSVDGRPELVEVMQKKYPSIKPVCYNLDSEDWVFEKYDIIINFGLVYHLQNYHKQHLSNCIKNSKLMFFETVVYDSYDSELFFTLEKGWDQSLSGLGGTPSTSFIEKVFNDCGCTFTKHCDSKLNGDGHLYDWQDTGSKIYNGEHRRFWVTQTLAN